MGGAPSPRSFPLSLSRKKVPLPSQFATASILARISPQMAKKGKKSGTVRNRKRSLRDLTENPLPELLAHHKKGRNPKNKAPKNNDPDLCDAKTFQLLRPNAPDRAQAAIERKARQQEKSLRKHGKVKGVKKAVENKPKKEPLTQRKGEAYHEFMKRVRQQEREELAAVNKRMVTDRQKEKRRDREKAKKERIRAKKADDSDDDMDKAFTFYSNTEKIAFGDVNERPPSFMRGGRVSKNMGNSMEEFASRANSMGIPKLPKAQRKMKW